MKPHRKILFIVFVAFALVCAAPGARAQDPLPSWNEGPAKKVITEFVTRVMKQGERDFVPVAERIAVFDNDGTLWCEQPMYVQMMFLFDRVRALAPQHPEWDTKQPFKAVLAGDFKTLAAQGAQGVMELMAATHAGMSTEEFIKTVTDWIITARHPKTGRLYTEMVYQPMLEVLAYLRANGFKTFIVSGGGIEFMRPWTEKVYGIPPEQVIGSSIKTKYELRDGKPVLMRLAEVDHINDGPGKPGGIHRVIWRRPIAAFGNSDGDQQMLEWTHSGGSPRLMMLVHHDDAKREWAYSAESKIGTFSDALMAEAKKKGWTVITMKKDWKNIFPFEGK